MDWKCKQKSVLWESFKMQQEYLDIVNDNDQVIDSAPFQDIYKNMSQHRIVHILIFNQQGELLLQMRSKTKSTHPSHWSTSVSGHVKKGETYKQAALREAKEELGIVPEITEMYKEKYTNAKGHRKFLTVYQAIDTGHTFSLDPEEVERVEYKSLEEIKHMIQAGDPFHPELLFILQKHFGL